MAQKPICYTWSRQLGSVSPILKTHPSTPMWTMISQVLGKIIILVWDPRNFFIWTELIRVLLFLSTRQSRFLATMVPEIQRISEQRFVPHRGELRR